ncbi:hypothetical protein AA0X95_04420 [Bacillus sp. 1P10SD]|uniref:hypothetical protein n=1 Tax=Bacillus sp. 1P10SD TaxID=3132265 RepID=UPI0039A56754
MMTTSTEVDFKQALKDLQEVNDELFYDELKSKLTQHIQHLEDEYAKVECAMEGVQFKLERFEDDFQRITQEAATQLRATVANLQQDVPSLFEEQLSVLGDVFVSFSDLAEEQKKILQDSEQVWRELSTRVLTRQKENYTSIMTELHAHSLKQQEDLKAFFEVATSEHKEQVQEVAGIIKGFKENVDQKHEEVKEGFAQVEALVSDATQTFQVQLKIEQQKRETQWMHQQDELDLIKQEQEEHWASSKKWVIGVVITQVVLLAAIGGLYLI